MPEVTWTCLEIAAQEFQTQKTKLSNCLANCTYHLLKVEDAIESSALFSLKLSFSRSVVNILQHRYWKVVLVLCFKGLVVLWNVYLQKWWSSRKYPFFSLPKYMQLNGDKQLFPYIFTLPKGEMLLGTWSVAVCHPVAPKSFPCSLLCTLFLPFFSWVIFHFYLCVPHFPLVFPQCHIKI